MRVLGHPVAVGGDQTEPAGNRAQAAHHFADRHHHIAVPRTAVVHQPARDGEIARVILGDAQFPTGNLDRGRKATVEIEHGHVSDCLARHGQRLASHCPDCRRYREIEALGRIPVVVTLGTTVQEHPLRFRDAKFLRRADGSHDERGRLVDERVRHHQSRIGKADPAIVGIDRREAFRAVPLAARGPRVFGGHARKARHELAHVLHMRRQRTAACGSNRIFIERVLDDCGTQIVAVFVIVPAAARVADQFGRSAGVFLPGDRQIRALHAVLGAQCLAAHDHRRAHPARRDLLGELVDQGLGHVAAVPGVDMTARRQAQPVGDALWRIARSTEPGLEAVRGVLVRAQHRDRVYRPLQSGSARIGQREPAGFGDQVVGRTAAFDRRVEVGQVAATNEDRGISLGLHGVSF